MKNYFQDRFSISKFPSGISRSNPTRNWPDISQGFRIPDILKANPIKSLLLPIWMLTTASSKTKFNYHKSAIINENFEREIYCDSNLDMMIKEQ